MRAIDGIDGKHLYVSSLHVCLTNATPNKSTHPPVSTHGMAIEPFRLLNFAGLLHLGKGWSNGRQALRGHRIGVAPEKAKPHRAGDRRGTWPAGARRSPQPQSRCPPPPPRARPVACVGEKGFAFAHPVSPRRRGDGGSSAKRSRTNHLRS